MGCIETCQCHNHSPFDTRLTLTWDVLKLGSGKSLAVCNQINFNMGCIETIVHVLEERKFEVINFNMGCIETGKPVRQ